MRKRLTIRSVKMTPQVMMDLEERGLIIRLCPSREEHRLNVEKGTGRGGHIYVSERTSAHSLVNVAIDNDTFSSFATHDDNEEFLLLGGVNERGLLLLVSYLSRDDLVERLKKKTLLPSDFICLDCVFNDPYVSFFTMKKGVPHGECAYGGGRPATFYCTENGDLSLDTIDVYEAYDLVIE